MKSKLRAFFIKDTSNWKFWLLLALIFKGVLFLLRLIQGHGDELFPIHGFWGATTSDSMSYFGPIEHLLTAGSYGKPIRLPGYGAIYLFFRLFCSMGIACNFVITIQYILTSLSVYCLAVLVKNVTGNTRLFYIVYYLFLISSYANWMDVDIMTESLSTSFLVLSVFFFVEFFNKRKIRSLLFSGGLLTWLIFMRPFFAVLLPIFCCILFYQAYKSKMQPIKAVLIFVSSFIVIDGAWVVRNFSLYKQIIPLTFHAGALPNLNNCQMSSVRFVQSFGGNFNTGDDKSIYHWFGFMSRPIINIYKGAADPIPDYIYTSEFNKDSLLMLKKLCTAIDDSVIPDSLKENGPQSKKIISTFNRYTASIRKEHPFLYYIKTPTLYTKEILTFEWASYNVIGYSAYHKSVLNYFNSANYVIIKLFKVNPVDWLYMLSDYLILIFGILGMFLLVKVCFKNAFAMLFLLIPLCTILIHPILLRMVANRFIMPAWPFIIVCAAYFIMEVTNSGNRLQSNERAN